MVRKIINPVSSQSPVDLDTVDNTIRFCVVYHDDEDTLFLRPERALPATSVDWNGEIWVRVNVKTREIVGLEIDELESVFLKRHPELGKAWREIKPLSKRQQVVSGTGPALLILLNFLKTLLKKSPSQPRFAGVTS